ATYNYLHYVDYPLIGKMKEIKKFDFYNIEKERSEFNYNYTIAKNGYTGSQNAPDFHHVGKLFDVPLFYESRTNLVGYNMPSFYLVSYRIKLEKDISSVFEGNKSTASETEYQYYDDTGYAGFNLSYKLFKKIYTGP